MDKIAKIERFAFIVLCGALALTAAQAAGPARARDSAARPAADPATYLAGVVKRRIGVERARDALTSMIVAAGEKGIPVILLTPTGDLEADYANPRDPLALQADMIRALARERGMALVDSDAEFRRYVRDGGALADLMSQVNHPNRKGHELVARALLNWFPSSGFRGPKSTLLRIPLGGRQKHLPSNQSLPWVRTRSGGFDL